MKNGLRSNGINEGSSVWNSVQAFGKNFIDGCNKIIIPESKYEESKVPDVSGGDTMLWHQRLGHIRQKCLQ